MVGWDWLGSCCAQAWSVVMPHLIETAIVGLGVGLLVLALRNGPARVRHALWLIAAIKLMVPAALISLLLPPLSVFAPLEWPPSLSAVGTGNAGVTWLTAIAGTNGRAADHTAPLVAALAVVWALGFAAAVARGSTRYRASAAIVSRTKPPIGQRECAALRRVANGAGIPGFSNLRLSSEIAEPAVWGLIRPVLLLPEGLAAELNDGELETVLAHELAHIRRRDHWIGALQAVAGAVFWFYPISWLIDRRLRFEREQACDEEVLRFLGRRHDYIAALQKVFRFGLNRPAWVSLLGGSNLTRRVKMIERNQGFYGLDGVYRGLVALTALGVIVASLATAGAAKDSRSSRETAAATAVGQDTQAPAEGTQAKKATASPASQSKPVRLTGRMKDPKLVHRVDPEYPAAAKKERVQGVVILEAVVGTDGQVANIEPLSGGKAVKDTRLIEAAIQAVKQWRYEPALLDGKPIAVIMTVTANFKLD